ncbi:MAG: SDR family oxidoreductase [Planctomycetaceae bacterium]
MAAPTEQPKVALITGSGRPRVGNVIARHLAARGYSIAIHFHSSGKYAVRTVDELRTAGTTCQAFQADVSDEVDVDRMFGSVRQHFGRLDLLVTTSSVWKKTPLSDVNADDIRRSFDVNTLGTFFCARAAGLIMAKQPEGGSIVTIGDWAIARPGIGFAAYYLAKGSIPTLTRMLAVELAALNPKVRVNCIHPGPVMFPPSSSEDEQRSLIDATLVKHADCPESIASAVEFLANNTFITGACIPVEGGRSIFSPGDAIERGV